MIHQRDALYRAIARLPDEDTPRLAYADLVEEEGDGSARRSSAAGRAGECRVRRSGGVGASTEP